MGKASCIATRSQQVSSHHTAQSLWSRWMVLVLCVIMDIHPGATAADLMGLRLGGYCAMFRPISLPLTFRWSSCGGGGDATPMRRLLSPGVSERCSSAASGQGERGHPSVAIGLGWKNTDTAQAFTLHAPLCTPEVLGPLSKKFRHEQLRGIREWQVYSRSQRRGRLTIVSGWGTGSDRAACVLSASPAFLPPGGFSRQALLPLPACLHIITAPSHSPPPSHFCSVL